MLLLVASVAAGVYLLLGRHSRTGPTTHAPAFATTSQNLMTAALSVPAEAQKVQRFLELHTFDADALRSIGTMQGYANELETIASHASGARLPLAEAQVTAAQQAITAVTQFRQAVAFSYKLSNANAARQTLDLALAAMAHNVKAWSRA